MTKFFKVAKYLLLFVGIFLFFFWLSNFDKFADPDSFYHVKMAEFLSQGKIFRTFPYLPFTTLSDAFADQHFLYHSALLPFFAVFKNHLFAAKIAANFFAALIFVLFYWLLGKLKIRWRIIYVLVLLPSSTFIFRMNSPKAGVLSVILMLLLFWLIWEKKYWAVILCSFLWVLTHGSWPLAILMALSFVLAQAIISFLKIPLNPPLIKGETKGDFPPPLIKGETKGDFPPPFEKGEERRGISKRLLSGENIGIFVSACGGVIFGLIFNPFFPKNLSFYWAQIFKIGFLNYAHKFGVGSEWYPPSFLEMISRTGLVLPLLVFAVFIFILGAVFKRKDFCPHPSSPSASGGGGKEGEEFKKVVFSGFFTVLTFLLALKSRRNIEYFVPTAALFGAILANLGASAADKGLVKKFLDDVLKKIRLKIAAVFLAACFGASLGYVFCHNVSAAHFFFQNGFSWDRLQKVSEFLKNNSAAGEIVFNGGWDDFPMLFYFNDKNYYISGLDPTFLYLQNRGLFEKYNQISSDKETPDLSKIIKNDFKAKYAVISKEHPKIKTKFSDNEGFELVYEDEEAWIYSIK